MNKREANIIINSLKEIKDLNVLVIGELIIDQYCYGKYLGKMRRKSIMEFMEYENKYFLGGAGIVANHIIDFVNSVSLLSLIGDENNYMEIIDEYLDSRVNPLLLHKNKSDTPIKKRYIDKDDSITLFKSSCINDKPINKVLSKNIVDFLDSAADKYDLIIVMDYGLGMISPEIISKLEEKTRFLAANTQINVENRGYNTIDKYHKSEYACINEDELRLVCKEKYTDVKILVNKLTTLIDTDYISVTRGPYGSVVNSIRDYEEVEAFANDRRQVVDTMGAGDCYFAISSLFACIGCSSRIVGLAGNIAGAIHSNAEGNTPSINTNIFKEKLEEITNDG